MVKFYLLLRNSLNFRVHFPLGVHHESSFHFIRSSRPLSLKSQRTEFSAEKMPTTKSYKKRSGRLLVVSPRQGKAIPFDIASWFIRPPTRYGDMNQLIYQNPISVINSLLRSFTIKFAIAIMPTGYRVTNDWRRGN